MKNIQILFENAKNLHTSGKIIEAQKKYIEISKLNQKNFELFFLLGTTFLQQKNYNESIANFDIAIKLNSNFPNSYNNKGIALASKNNHEEAILYYNKAIKLKKNYFDAYLNKGISLNKLKKYDEAINYFKNLIKIDPNNPKIYNNLGNVFKNTKKFNEAIKIFDEAIKINPNFIDALINKSECLEKLKQYEKALDCIEKALKLNPKLDDLLERKLSNKMLICDWDEFENITQLIKKKILLKQICISPLFVHYLFDDSKINKLNTEKFNQDEENENKKLLIKKKKNNKIIIGYFSSNFHNHPVLHTMIDVFKNHDISKFDIYGFSNSPNTKNNFWNEKIKNYFKGFFLINEMSNHEVFNLVKNINLDIAIDLTGLTENSITEIFVKRIAPIQINYLGYPGSSGLKTMDYILADKIVIPEREKKHYSEKIAYVPGCFIPSSNNILLKNKKKVFSRSEFNLPMNEIIFCAFHNSFKINPTLFSIWMNILNKTGNSKLWIKTDNELVKKNLKIQAEKNFVNPERIIFAEKLDDINDHIERMKLADIFLDAYPYNSHSSTYDCIRANLPMVIWKGNTFASRVAASIYSSIHMQELIAKNNIEYENIAINLANDFKKIEMIKKKIIDNSIKYDVFNNKNFTKKLENVYMKILNIT